MGPETKEIGVTLEIEPEKPVDIDVATLLDDKSGLPAAGALPPVEKAQDAAPSASEEEEEAVEIDVSEPEGPDPVEELRSQLEQMKEAAEKARQAAEESRQERERMEAEARALQQQVEAQAKEVRQTQYHAVSNAIAAHRADADALQRTFAAALRNGDHKVAGEAQRAMARVESILLTLEESKEQLEYQIKNPEPARRPEPQRQEAKKQSEPASTGDPVEDFIQSRSPRVQQYLRARDRTWVADPNTNKKMIAAHYMAMANNYVEESDAYFDFIDQQMGIKKAQAQNQPSQKPKTAQKKVPPSAPISSRASAPNSHGVNGTKVHLTPRERDTAKALGMTEAQYATAKFKMSQPGYDGPQFD